MANIADLYSEPCLLLAEHIANEAASLRNRANLYRIADNTAVGIYNEETGLTELLPVGHLPLSDDVYDPDARITSLELIWHRRLHTRTWGLFNRHASEYWEDDTERPMMITAVVRGVRVPIMTITSEPVGDCRFVKILGDVDITNNVDDNFSGLVVTERDLNGEREEVLKTTYALLREVGQTISEYPSRDSKALLHLPSADITNMNVVDRVREVLGTPNEDIEYILETCVALAEKKRKHPSNPGLRATTIDCNIQVNGTEFPGRIHVEVFEGDEGMKLYSVQEIPGARSFGRQMYLPVAHINPMAMVPIQFEGIVNEEVHQQLLMELRDLMLMIPDKKD